MAAGKLNLVIEQGATFKKTITVQDKNGVAINLANSDIVGVAKQRINSSTELFEFEIIERIDNLGKFSIYLPDEATTLLNFTTGVYDIQIRFLDGTVMRLLEGNIVLNKGVTL